MPLTNGAAKQIQIKTQPSNYGINHIAVGVASLVGDTLTSSLLVDDFSHMILTRSFQRHPSAKHYIFASTQVTGTTRFFYTSVDRKNIGVGDVLVAKLDSPSNVSITGVITTVPTARKFGILSADSTVYGGGGGMAIYGGDVTPLAVILPPASTWKTSPTTELGIPATYHFYDTGAISGTVSYTTNPGKGVVSTAAQGSEAFYSLHVYDSTYFFMTAKNFEEVFVKDYSSKSKMMEYLPGLYKTNSVGNYNKDLEDFISVFAFQYDKWRTDTDLIFNRGIPENIDSKLLKLALSEFGFDYSKITDIRQARLILSNIVNLYQTKGSTYGIKLASELITGADVTATTAVKNLIPDQNSAGFVENRGKIIWTVDGSISPTSAISATTAVPPLGPAFDIVSSPHYGYNSTTANVVAHSGNGMLFVNARGSGEFRILSSPRFAVLNSTAPVGQYNLDFKYADYRTGDYIFLDDSFVQGSWVKGAINNILYLGRSSDSSNQVNSAVKKQLNAGTKVYLSQNNNDLVAASTKMIPVATSTQYTFSFYANSGNYTGADVTPFVYWYKVDGTPASTVVSTGGTSGLAQENAWSRVQMSATSPSDAFYAAPGWKLVRTSTVASQSGYFFDSVQFEVGATATTFELPAKISVTATTSGLSNFNAQGVLLYNFKDMQTSSFIPAYRSAAIPSTLNSFNAFKISDIGTSTGSGGFKTIKWPHPVTGILTEYSTATISITANKFANAIVPGQTLNIKGYIGGTPGNDIDSAIVIGKLNDSENTDLLYRIAKLKSTTSMVATAVATSSATLNLLTNYVNQPTITFKP